MNVYFRNAKSLIDGIELLTEDLGITLSDEGKADYTVTVCENETVGYTLSFDGKAATITYGGGKARFFRALALLIQWIKDGVTRTITETPLFKTNGTMLDTSRNAVMNLNTSNFICAKWRLWA